MITSRMARVVRILAPMLVQQFLGAVCTIPCVAAADVSRDDEPVLIQGAALSEFDGMALSRIGVFRWNSASDAFEPIPFQTDERIAKTFNPGTPIEFTETMYDVLHEDDGCLDADDELAFLMGDAGPQAPADGPWLAGADDERLEISVVSALPGRSAVTRWVYVFAGDALPRSAIAYVQWDGQQTSPVATTAMTVDYAGRWLLTAIRVNAPCGSGADLIDRVKGRARTLFGNEEDEENWSLNSVYLGGIAGPVRAIRYVRGATSGVNTIHHDVIYRKLWRREVNLRVHPLAEASLYIDWRSAAGVRFYSASVPGGVDVDGVPDPVPTTYVPWFLTRSPDGGLAVVNEVPLTSRYQTRTAIYRDDASFNDQIPLNPSYGDEDDSAYGDHGLKLGGLGDSNIDAIVLWTLAYPLCSNFGDASVGAAYREFFDEPIQARVLEQPRLLAVVRSLAVSRDANDVVLAWQPVAGAVTFNVYRAEAPGDPHDLWTLLGHTAGTVYRDPGAAGGSTAYYSVVAVGSAGEGGW